MNESSQIYSPGKCEKRGNYSLGKCDKADGYSLGKRDIWQECQEKDG